MVSHQPGFCVTGWMLNDMLIAGQRMAGQHRIAAVGIERAVGLIGDLKGREFDAGIELERLVGTELDHQRMRPIRLAHAVGHVKHRAGLDHSHRPGLIDFDR